MAIAIILGLILGIGGAIWFVTLMVRSHSQAKADAKAILASGVITDTAKADQVLKLLSAGIDMESRDLWKRLSEMREAHRMSTI